MDKNRIVFHFFCDDSACFVIFGQDIWWFLELMTFFLTCVDTFQTCFTGVNLSEALNLTSIKPKYGYRLFVDLPLGI